MSNRPTAEELAAHIKRHIDEGGMYCPACDSADCMGGRFQSDASGAWIKVKCAACGTVWFDCFTLTRTEIVKWRGEK